MGYPLNHKSVQEIYRETAQKYDLKLHSLNLGALLSEGTMNYAEGTTKGNGQEKVSSRVLKHAELWTFLSSSLR